MRLGRWVGLGPWVVGAVKAAQGQGARQIPRCGSAAVARASALGMAGRGVTPQVFN
jgi:hypothetical protein